MGMSEEHRNILINNRSYIVKNLKFSDMFSAVMREGNIITEEFEDEIKVNCAWLNDRKSNYEILM